MMPRLVTGCLLGLALASPVSRGDDRSPELVRVPFDLLPTKHITVQVKLNGKGPYRMIFDTGAPVSILNTRTAKESGISSKGGGVFALFGSLDQAKIKKVEIGGLKAENVPIIVMDHPTIELVSRAFGQIEGIVGFPLFARYRMILDYQSREMTFTPNGYEPGDLIETLTALLTGDEAPKPRVVAPAGLWGFSVDKKANDDEGGVLITKVLDNSPAARAGLRIGDRLLSLDDRWTDSVVDCYTAAEHVKPGTVARARIQRAGQEIDLNLTPENGL
jgi:hypothetical protein